MELIKFIVRQIEYLKPVGLNKINEIGISKWFINLYI